MINDSSIQTIRVHFLILVNGIIQPTTMSDKTDNRVEGNSKSIKSENHHPHESSKWWTSMVGLILFTLVIFGLIVCTKALIVL